MPILMAKLVGKGTKRDIKTKNFDEYFVPFCPFPFGLSWWKGEKKERETPPMY